MNGANQHDNNSGEADLTANFTGVAFAPASSKPRLANPAIGASEVDEEEVFELRLVGPIAKGGPVCVAAVKEKLARIPAGAHIKVIISSSGGSPDEAFGIYDILRARPVPVSAVATCHLHSAAVLPFLAADHRVIKPDTTVLLHSARIFRKDIRVEELTTRDFALYAGDLAALDARIVDLLVARTGFDREFFEREMLDEDCLTASDALASGLVHEIEGLTERCHAAWPEKIIEAIRSGAIRNVYVSDRMLTAHYFAACRAAPVFSK